MEKNVLINIRGIYLNEDGEEDVVELFTTGTYALEDDCFIISYEETESTGFEGSFTTLKVEPNKMVTMTRDGDASAQLMVQNGVRHQCRYDIGYGDMTIGISGKMIRSTLTEHGGDLEFRYALDINSLLASENELHINIKEC